MTKIWINNNQLKEIKRVLSHINNLKKTVLFWSRAKGTYKEWSDVDIAVFFDNKEDLTWQVNDKLNNETLIPYKFDVINYDNITNKNLKDHIDRVWIEI